MKKVNIRKIRIAQWCMICGALLCLLAAVIHSILLWSIAAVLLLTGLLLSLSANRCPYCGEYFRGISFGARDGGFCRKCGRKIEFDR